MPRLALGLLLAVSACGLPGALAPPAPVTLEWRVLSSSPTSRTVVLEAFRGACDEEQRPQVTESRTRVVVRLTALRGSGACTDQAVAWTPTIVLASPLGQREVVAEDTAS